MTDAQPTIVCHEMHSAAEIPEADWRCPKCKSEDFALDGEFGAEGCNRLHLRDYAHCIDCGHGASVRKLVRDYMRKARLVTCPHCKGRGVVEESHA